MVGFWGGVAFVFELPLATDLATRIPSIARVTVGEQQYIKLIHWSSWSWVLKLLQGLILGACLLPSVLWLCVSSFSH